MTHEERMAKIEAEKQRKEQIIAEIKVLKAQGAPTSVVGLLKRVELIEKMLGL